MVGPAFRQASPDRLLSQNSPLNPSWSQSCSLVRMDATWDSVLGSGPSSWGWCRYLGLCQNTCREHQLPEGPDEEDFGDQLLPSWGPHASDVLSIKSRSVSLWNLASFCSFLIPKVMYTMWKGNGGVRDGENVVRVWVNLLLSCPWFQRKQNFMQAPSLQRLWLHDLLLSHSVSLLLQSHLPRSCSMSYPLTVVPVLFPKLSNYLSDSFAFGTSRVMLILV